MKFFKNMFLGFTTIFVSLKMVLAQPKIIAFSAVSTIWSFFASPLLLSLVGRYNYLNIPGYIFVFIFSSIGLIIFNFVHLGVAFFQLETIERGKNSLSLKDCVLLSWNKITMILWWALISSLIGTALFHSYALASTHSDTLALIFFETIEFVWWLVNFLIVPVFIGQRSVSYAASWTLKAIFTNPGTLIGAGGGFLLLKYGLIKIILYQIITSAPYLLTYFNIVSFTAEDPAFLLFVLMPVIGVLVTVCSSIVLSTVESTIAANIYAILIRKGKGLVEADFLNLALVTVLTFISFVVIAFALASSIVLLATTIPVVKSTVIQFLQFF